MTIEEDVRKCCSEVESIRKEAERLRSKCNDETRKSFSRFDSKLERFVREAGEATEKLNAGLREGLERLVAAWQGAGARLSAHLRLIEAKGFLMGARRLAGEGDFLGAENELKAAVRDVQEAQKLMPGGDEHVNQLLRDIDSAVEAIRSHGAAATADIEATLRHNDELLDELGGAA
jgi:hypothetical protein